MHANCLKPQEDLGNIEFTAGEFQLPGTAKKKLRLLTDAMTKRPKMRFSGKGVYDQNSDVVALQKEQVKSTLQKSGVNVDALMSHNELWAAAINTQFK